MAWAKVTAGSDKAVGTIVEPVQWAVSAGPRWAVVELSPADFDKIDRGAEKRGVPSYYCRTPLGIRFWPVAGHDGEFVGLEVSATPTPIVGRASVGDMTWEVTCLGGTPDAEFQVRMALAMAICPEHFNKGPAR